MKIYEIKFYNQKAGQSAKFTHSIFGGDLEAKEELLRLAELDRNGDNDYQVDENIGSIEDGASSFYYDSHTTFYEIQN